MRALRLPLLLSWLLTAACGEPAVAPGEVTELSQSGEVEATVRFDGAVRHGDNTLLVSLTPLDAETAPPLTFVEATMPAHGHASQADEIDQAAQGRFEVRRLNLFMSGRWLVELGLGDGDSVSFPVDVP